MNRQIKWQGKINVVELLKTQTTTHDGELFFANDYRLVYDE